MNTLWSIVGAVVLLLLSMLGIQTKRVGKQKEKTKQAEAQVEAEQQQGKVKEEVIKTKDRMEENNKAAQKAKEETTIKIGEAGNDTEKQQDIIDGINSGFNDNPRSL